MFAEIKKELDKFFMQEQNKLFLNAVINCKLFPDYNEWLFLGREEWDLITMKLVKAKFVFEEYRCPITFDLTWTVKVFYKGVMVYIDSVVIRGLL